MTLHFSGSANRASESIPQSNAEAVLALGSTAQGEARPENLAAELLTTARAMADRSIQLESPDVSPDGDRYALCTECFRGGRGAKGIDHAPSCVVGRFLFLLGRAEEIVRETRVAIDAEKATSPAPERSSSILPCYPGLREFREKYIESFGYPMPSLDVRA